MQIASAAGINNSAAKPGQLILPGQQKKRKVGRNDPCPCGSGKKFKKCHMNRGRKTPKVTRRPVERPIISGAHVDEVSQSTEAPADKQPTAHAMLRAGVDKRIVWAYLETGLFITEANKMAQPPERLAQWDVALASYDTASDEDRRILVVEE